MVVIGLFQEINPAADALRSLEVDIDRDADDIMVLSSVPFPEGVLDVARPKSMLPAATIVCAIAGIALGLLLAGGSAALYVLRTGGKPIESGPPIAIIAYEAMMLVALTGAFLAALYEMRLPSWRAKVYDRRISEGLIGIAVHCIDDDQATTAETQFRKYGAVDVTRDARSLD